MLSIGEFSKLSNVTTKTLRYYDKIGLLKPIIVNNENGYRQYSVEQLKTMIVINKLKEYQFTLCEIAAVINSDSKDNLLLNIAKSKKDIIETEVRHNQNILKCLNKDIGQLERGLSFMTDINNIKVEKVQTETKTVCFVRERVSVKNFDTLVAKAYKKIADEKLTITGCPMAIYYDEKFDPDNADIEFCIPVKEETNSTRTFEGTTCAMARLEGPYTGLTAIYAKLLEWIEKNGYSITNAPYDSYVTNPDETDEENYITEVYFPIK